MLNYPYLQKSAVDTPIEESTETLVKATVLLRQLTTEKTGRNAEDIYIPTLVYCARECCLQAGSPTQNDWREIEKNVHLIANTSATAQNTLAKALSCAVEEIPLRQTMNLALDAIWEQEYRMPTFNKSIEASIETLVKATVLVRQSITEKTGRGVEDIPILTLLYCARECCLDEGSFTQNDWEEIEKNAHLIANTSAMVQSRLAEALSCAVEEISMRQIMALALETIWEHEQRMVNKHSSEHEGELIKMLDDAM